MKTYPDNLRSQAHAGFSLVDIMVGMVIAMLGVIIIFQVFSVSEGIKRTTTSGGDALQSGATALFSLERLIKSAGYGFFPANTVWVWPAPADPANPVAVTITAGGSPTCAAAGAATNSDCLIVGYRQNWEYGSFPPASGVGYSFVPAALTFETISVNNQAQLISSINGVIADGIALIKAEYGTDTTGTGIVNTWTQAVPGNPLSVHAVRIVVVARSAQPEVTRTATGQIATCATTTTAPTWIDSATVPLDLSGNTGLAVGDDWKCYRYKTFENTVPLRN